MSETTQEKQEKADQDWVTAKELAQKAVDAADLHFEAMKNLIEFTIQNPLRAEHQAIYHQALLQVMPSSGGRFGLRRIFIYQIFQFEQAKTETLSVLKFEAIAPNQLLKSGANQNGLHQRRNFYTDH